MPHCNIYEFPLQHTYLFREASRSVIILAAVVTTISHTVGNTLPALGVMKPKMRIQTRTILRTSTKMTKPNPYTEAKCRKRQRERMRGRDKEEDEEKKKTETEYACRPVLGPS